MLQSLLLQTRLLQLSQDPVPSQQGAFRQPMKQQHQGLLLGKARDIEGAADRNRCWMSYTCTAFPIRAGTKHSRARRRKAGAARGSKVQAIDASSSTCMEGAGVGASFDGARLGTGVARASPGGAGVGASVDGAGVGAGVACVGAGVGASAGGAGVGAGVDGAGAGMGTGVGTGVSAATRSSSLLFSFKAMKAPSVL